ncbi:MAG TPA: STAS domain-containing protein [Microthrixaceae bacterium]|nr:STAS domain-containing protein [Microthrixaceae bacterium]
MDGDVLQVHVSQHGGHTVCRPVGELDAFTVGGFRDQLAEIEATGGIVIDLSDVPFMDSAGLGALIGGIRRVRDGGGSVAVVCSRPAVLRLLHTTGFDRIVDVSATLDEAIETLS